MSARASSNDHAKMESLTPTLKNLNHQFNYYYYSNAILVLNIQKRNDVNCIFRLFALFTAAFDPSLAKGYDLVVCCESAMMCLSLN